MNALKYIKIKGEKFLAWATKQDVSDALIDTNERIGNPVDESGKKTTISQLLLDIKSKGTSVTPITNEQINALF